MGRAWVACVSVVLALGCQSGEVPPRGAHRGVEPSSTFHPRPDRSQLPVDAPRPEPHEPALDVLQPPAKEPERDLGAELKAALGTPLDCIRDFVADRPTAIRVSVTAIVRPTGMIIEPSAHGAGLSSAALRCIEQRVGTVVLQPLNQESSEPVAEVIELQYEPVVVVESDPGVPEPVLKDVVQPLPKRPVIPASGRPIEAGGRARPIEGPAPRPPEGPAPKKITGPKPRPIEGYEVDENAQEWR